MVITEKFAHALHARLNNPAFNYHIMVLRNVAPDTAQAIEIFVRAAANPLALEKAMQQIEKIPQLLGDSIDTIIAYVGPARPQRMTNRTHPDAMDAVNENYARLALFDALMEAATEAKFDLPQYLERKPAKGNEGATPSQSLRALVA